MEQILWAVKGAPVADAAEWAVLVAMAEAADQDGTNSFLSVPTIAERTRLAERTVQRRIGALEERGLLRRGDQSVARMIPIDRRPVVYDLQVPYSYFRLERTYQGDQPELSVNVWRAGRGRPPLTPQSRPELAPPPDKAPRKDKGTKRPKKVAVDPGVTVSHPDGVTLSQGRGDSESARGVTQSHPTLPTNPPHDPPHVRGASSSVVSPPVTRERTNRTTPTQMLDQVGLARRDHGRFKAWMRTTKNARSADAVIATSDPDDLVAQVREWRATLTFRTDRDAEPLLCRHGNDVALGDHMCPACDPDRPDITTVSGDIPDVPDWVQAEIDAGRVPPMPQESHA